MEKFLKLPLYQRFLIVFAVMLVIFGGDYYFYILNIQDEINTEKIKARRANKEYSALMPYQDKEKLKQFKDEFAKEQKKIEENKKMLPTDEEIPEFVKSIYSDAKVSGLAVTKIEKKAEEPDDYYKKIPIYLEVRGNFFQLIKFFKTITSPQKRIVNIANINIEKMPVDLEKIMRKMGQSRLQFWEQRKIDKKIYGTKMTGTEARLFNYQKWDEANKLAMFEANFIVYTFSYTGKPMTDKERHEKLRKRKQRRKRHR